MGLIDRFLRKPPMSADDRRRKLLATGRITDGVILDSEAGASGEEIVVYLYTLNGVDFESSDLLTDAQKEDPIRYAPGARVGIRYDPKNQGNSIIE
jgi:hypothetical protein